jgi:hypothetical protein
MQGTNLPPLNPYGVDVAVDAPAPPKPSFAQARWGEGLARAILLALIASAAIGVIGGTTDWRGDHPGNQTMWRWLNRFGLYAMGGFFSVGVVILAAGILSFVPPGRPNLVPDFVHCFFTYIAQWFAAILVITLLGVLPIRSGTFVATVLGPPVIAATFLAWSVYIYFQLRQRLMGESTTDGLS